MAELTPLYMDISGVYSGDELGLPYRDLVAEGIVGENDLLVSERAAGADLSVDVAAGAAWVLGDTNEDAQPIYRVRNDAVVNLGISPDPSNPRIVSIIAQITDETFAGSGREWELQALHGTPAGSPVAPTLPDSALLLASVAVDAGATTVVDADITDARAYARIGGQLGAWSNYTPEVTGSVSDPTLGSGSSKSGAYTRIGDTVMGRALVNVGTTGFVNGSGILRVTLPEAAVHAEANEVIGAGWIFDSSAGSFWFGVVELDTSGSRAFFRVTNDASSAVQATFTAPFTWGQGDILSLNFTYRGA